MKKVKSKWRLNSLCLKKEYKQILQITYLTFSFWFSLFFYPILLLYFLLISENLIFRILALLYLCWMIYDKDTPDKGRGLGWLWLKDKYRFDSARDYFPVDLIKTVDLPPNRNYLFAVFPHGVYCYGVMFNFVSLSSKFWKLYPRIRPRVLTLYQFFQSPIFRDFLLLQGAASASVKCLKALLSVSNDPENPINSDGFTSNAAILVVGGVREIILSRPGEYRLIAGSRKGFVKHAIINGAPLVPVFSFGEVDVYDQPPNPPGSKRREWQELTKRYLGFPLMTFSGAWGFIPKRKPINTVVGAPIEVIKTEKPTEEYVNEVHLKFLDALVNLFETHKSKYLPYHHNCHLILE